MNATVGLRERKKAATRQALHDAALRLVAERGIDQVTVEEIADAAMVSRRTFSNYFSNKEEALFHGHRVWVQRLVELVHARPAAEGPWDALRRATERLSAESADMDLQTIAARRLLRNHPSLVVHQNAVYAANERDLAAELIGRMPAAPDTPLRARVLAATFLATVRVASQHWIDNPDQSLPDLLRKSFAYSPQR
jgi:AcrR family transcriptional regulator